MQYQGNRDSSVGIVTVYGWATDGMGKRYFCPKKHVYQH